MIQRRSFLAGLGALFAVPAIVRAGSLMPIRGIVMDAQPWSTPLFMDGDMIYDGVIIRKLADFRQDLVDEFIRGGKFSPYMLSAH